MAILVQSIRHSHRSQQNERYHHPGFAAAPFARQHIHKRWARTIALVRFQPLSTRLDVFDLRGLNREHMGHAKGALWCRRNLIADKDRQLSRRFPSIQALVPDSAAA